MALTSVVIKVFERLLVLRYLKPVTSSFLDPLQFAYRENRSVADAVCHPLRSSTPIESPNTYAHILFIDYSSAFNTIVPQQFFDKFQLLSTDLSMCHWLLDFLLRRPQTVKLNSRSSGTVVLSTGAPQGCILSPLFYSLFTNDCVSHHDSVQLIKFADDTTLEGLISGVDESA